MTDDPVKQALAELSDLVRCRCHEAYKGRGLQDPQCMCDSADAVKVVTDRIEEADVIYSEMHIALTDAEDRIEELERQLKTVLDREAATHARHDAKMEALERERDELQKDFDGLDAASRTLINEARSIDYEQKDGMDGAVVDAIREILNSQNVPKAAFIDDHVANAIVQRNVAEARLAKAVGALQEARKACLESWGSHGAMSIDAVLAEIEGGKTDD